jgi:hypothetical protein
MTAEREKRLSEIIFDSIIYNIRNVDKLLWLGKKDFVRDIEKYVDTIKVDLDTVLTQFKIEFGYTEPEKLLTEKDDNIKPIPEKLLPEKDDNIKPIPFKDPLNNTWHCTPIIKEKI